MIIIIIMIIMIMIMITMVVAIARWLVYVSSVENRKTEKAKQEGDIFKQPE